MIDQNLLIIFVIALVVYYTTNAISPVKQVVRKYQYQNQSQLGNDYGSHGGLVVSSPEINVRTRGPEMNYQQQGLLYKEADDESSGPKHLMLYGRQKYPGSSQWEYMTKDKSLDDIKIPLNDQKNELMDDDTIDVKGFGSGYKVDLYPNQELRYLPY